MNAFLLKMFDSNQNARPLIKHTVISLILQLRSWSWPFSLWLKEDYKSIGLVELKANHFPLFENAICLKSVDSCLWGLRTLQMYRRNLDANWPWSQMFRPPVTRTSSETVTWYALYNRICSFHNRKKTRALPLEFHLLQTCRQVLSKWHRIYSALDFVGGGSCGQSVVTYSPSVCCFLLQGWKGLSVTVWSRVISRAGASPVSPRGPSLLLMHNGHRVNNGW